MSSKKTVKKVAKDVSDNTENPINNKAKGNLEAELNAVPTEEGTMKETPTQPEENNGQGPDFSTEGGIDTPLENEEEAKPFDKAPLECSNNETDDLENSDKLLKEKEDLEKPDQEAKERLAMEIKNLRERADWMQQVLSGSEHLNSDSFKKSFAKGRAWLGKLLGAIGNPNPYDVKITYPKDIPATADTVKDLKRIETLQKSKREFGMLGQLDAILEAREGLKSFCDAIDNLNIEYYGNLEDLDSVVKAGTCKTLAWSNLCEANFELGYLLSTLRK